MNLVFWKASFDLLNSIKANLTWLFGSPTRQVTLQKWHSLFLTILLLTLIKAIVASNLEPFCALKVSVFAWHLLLNRLPTKDNFILLGVDLASNTGMVVFSVVIIVEDVNHVLTKCR
ncbi:hypothetical protein SLA2020_529100 [Shorea laevis]